MIKYCRTCILPNTRPNIQFDESGNCNCATLESKRQIPWAQREEAFRILVAEAKQRSLGYDCVIPVSGGKDSTWQVITCLEYGLNPLCVTWKTPARTELGQKNLDNLVSLGVDHIEYQINPKTEKVFTRLALERFGTPAIPMHMAIFNMPVRVAVNMKIPLIVWGENSAFEYGGPEEERHGFLLDRRWYERYGVTHGTDWRDWICEELTEKNLVPYRSLSPKSLDAEKVRGVFLGYYFTWDPVKTFEVAKQHGFQERTEGPLTGIYNFADIDDDFVVAVHHWLKWYKFGFTRSWDNLSIEIRNHRITREQAIERVKAMGDEPPYEHIRRLCDYIGISEGQFFEIAEKFRNPEIWKNEDGVWKIPGFLIPDWPWERSMVTGPSALSPGDFPDISL